MAWAASSWGTWTLDKNVYCEDVMSKIEHSVVHLSWVGVRQQTVNELCA